MDMTQIIAAVAPLAPFVAPYLEKAGESVAANMGEGLYNLLKRKFAADQDGEAQQALQRLTAEPENDDHVKALAAILHDKAQADPSFAQAIQRFAPRPAATGGITNNFYADVGTSVSVEYVNSLTIH